MEQIKILKIESKTTKNDKPYKMCEVECQGETRKVNIWSNAPDFANLKEGSIIVGTMVKDGQYWNITFENSNTSPRGSQGFKTAQIKETMDIKRQDIARSQENKENSIKIASTIRMAVDIATSLTVDQWHSTTMEEEIRHWRSWLWQQWDDVGSDTMTPF